MNHHRFMIVTTAFDLEAMHSDRMISGADAIYDIVNNRWLKNRWGVHGSLHFVIEQLKQDYLAKQHLMSVVLLDFWTTG